MNEFNEFIINFVAENDPEFAEKLRAAAHEFSPEEAMRLIHTADVSIEKKHEAYKVLVALYPDHVLEWNSASHDKGETLANFLQEAVKTENELIAECMRDGDDAFYEMDACSDDRDWKEGTPSRFHTYQEAMRDIAELKQDTSFPPIAMFKIIKKYINGGSNMRDIALIYGEDGKTIINTEVRPLVGRYPHDIFNELKTTLPELQ